MKTDWTMRYYIFLFIQSCRLICDSLYYIYPWLYHRQLDQLMRYVCIICWSIAISTAMVVNLIRTIESDIRGVDSGDHKNDLLHQEACLVLSVLYILAEIVASAGDDFLSMLPKRIHYPISIQHLFF